MGIFKDEPVFFIPVVAAMLVILCSALWAGRDYTRIERDLKTCQSELAVY